MHFSVTTPIVKKIRSYGNSIRSGSVTVKYITHEEFRYSPVISKKQGNAVKRNRVKRIIRDIMLTGRKTYPQGIYMIYYNRHCDEARRTIILNDISCIMKKIERSTV